MSKWCVVRDKKLIASGAAVLSEEVATTFATNWNTLYAGANYEAITLDEAKKRYARLITWDDVGGQEKAKEKKVRGQGMDNLK